MEIGLGEILSLLCALLWAFAVIFYRQAGDHYDAYEMTLFKTVFAFVLMLPTAFLIEGPQMPEMTQQQIWLLIMSGFIGIMLADFFYLKALQLIGAGLTGLTGSLYSPFVVGLSMIWLGESLVAMQILGMALVIGGVVLISYRRRKNRNPAHEHPPIKGFVYAALGVFLTAVGIVMIKDVTEEVPFFWLMLVRTFGGLVSMFVFNFLMRQSLNIFHVIQSKGRNWLIAGTFLGQYLSAMVWVAGYKYTSASVASILNETASIFILFLSWLLLKEALTRRKLIGAMVSLSGVYLVLLYQSTPA